LNLQETVNVVTQFQQDNSIEVIANFSSRNSTINLQDPNLYITNKKNQGLNSVPHKQRGRLLKSISGNNMDDKKSDASNTLNEENNNNSDGLFIVNEHVAKHRYICKSYSKSGHNIRKCKYK
ncbi:3278_t:CDS:2, partial [Gigaspora margarita]